MKIKILLFAALFGGILLNACKKDIQTVNGNQTAKEWLTSKNVISMSLKTDKGDSIKLHSKYDWDNSVSFNDDLGTQITGVPLTLTINKGQSLKGGFMLLISKKNNIFKSILAYDKNQDFFNNISSVTLNSVYNNTINADFKKKQSESIKTYGEQICTDWYWEITSQDDYGGPVVVDMWYLYTTCYDPDGDGGGGNGGANELSMEEIIQSTELTITGVSGSGMFISENQIDETRLYSYSWEVGRNNIAGWRIMSYETGKHKKINNEWQWESLTHNNLSVDNKPSWLNIILTENGTPIPVLGTFAAGITVRFNCNATGLFYGSPFGAPTTDRAVNSPVFYSNIP